MEDKKHYVIEWRGERYILGYTTQSLSVPVIKAKACKLMKWHAEDISKVVENEDEGIIAFLTLQGVKYNLDKI